MSYTIPQSRLRLALDAALMASQVGQAVTDIYSGRSPVIVQATDLQVEVGVFWNGTLAADITNFASLTLQFQDSIQMTATALYSATGTLDTTCDAAAWAAQTKQHGLWNLTSVQTTFELVGKKKRKLWMTCWGTTTAPLGSKRIPLCATDIYVVDSGWADGATVIVASPGARMKDGKLQVFCPENSKYYDVMHRLVNGVPQLVTEGAGES